jgi:hypothetical protein
VKLFSINKIALLKILILAGCGMAIACGSKNGKNIPILDSGKKDAASGDGTEGEDDNSPTSGVNIGDPGSVVNGPIKLIDVTYKISVRMANFTICDGDIKIEVTVDLNNLETGKILNLPDGWVDCTLIGKIDLRGILGIFSTNSEMPKIKVKDSVIMLEKFGKATYNPARPFLPSFLAATKKQLKNLRQSSNVTITDSNVNVTASGTAGVEMLNFNSSYSSRLANKNFKKVMHFRTTAKGFNDVDKLGNFLFEELEMRMNMAPIALISIKARGAVGGMTGFIFRNKDKLPPDLVTLLELLPSKHNPGNPLSPLLGGIVDTVANVIYLDTTLEMSKYDGPDQEEKSEDDGKDKFGDSK